jgi:MFS family permease
MGETQVTEAPVGAGRQRIWSQPGYPVFWASATLGRLVDDMFPVAVVLLVLERTGSAALAGATLAAYTAPSVVTGPLLGAWLDRTTHRRALLALNRVAVTGSLLGILALTGRGPGWALPLLAGLGGLTMPMLTGGVTSLIPLLVPRRLLGMANALEATSYNLAGLAGPALAAAVTGVAGAGAAVGVQAAVGALALVGLAAPSPAAPAADRPAGSLRAQLGEGLRHLLATPVLRGITFATTAEQTAQALLPLTLPLLVTGMGAHVATAGWVLAALQAGAIGGALLVSRMGPGWDPPRVVLGGMALAAAVWASLALAPAVWALFVLCALAGAGIGPSYAAMFTVRQQWTPARLRGLVFTSASSIRGGAYALGAALAAPAVALAGTGGALVLGSVFLLAWLGLGVWWGALRGAESSAKGVSGAERRAA